MELPDIFDFSNYQGFLAEVYASKKLRNHRYSKSQFATGLGVRPSVLTEVLDGRRDLTRAAAWETTKRLPLHGTKSDYFMELHLLSLAEKSGNTRYLTEIHDRIKSLRSPDKDWDLIDSTHEGKTNPLLKSWHTGAAVEAENLSNFTLTPKKLGERLGIETIEARSAIRQAQSLDLVSNNQSERNRTTSWDIPDKRIQDHLLEIVNLSAEKLPLQDPKKRDYAHVIMAIDSSRLPEAKRMVKKFRRELMTFLEGGNSRDSLYCLATQLFSLDCDT